jgi:hypothetical protein
MNTLIKQEAERYASEMVATPEERWTSQEQREWEKYHGSFLTGASYAQSLQRPGWVKASDRLPELAGWKITRNVPEDLGSVSVLFFLDGQWYDDSGCDKNNVKDGIFPTFEWLDEGGSDGWISVEVAENEAKGFAEWAWASAYVFNGMFWYHHGCGNGLKTEQLYQLYKQQP